MAIGTGPHALKGKKKLCFISGLSQQQQQHHHHYGHQYVIIALLVLLLALLAAGDALGNVCGATSYYIANSTYEAYLELLIATLPRKAASFGALFAAATTRFVLDAVHSLAQCRGDVDASTYDACVTDALEDALRAPRSY